MTTDKKMQTENRVWHTNGRGVSIMTMIKRIIFKPSEYCPFYSPHIEMCLYDEILEMMDSNDFNNSTKTSIINMWRKRIPAALTKEIIKRCGITMHCDGSDVERKR